MIGEYYAMYLLPNPNKGVALHKIKTRLQTYYPARGWTADLVMSQDLL